MSIYRHFFTVQIDAQYESLADTIQGWASGLEIEATFTDPVLEESGTHDWAEALRRGCDSNIRTAASPAHRSKPDSVGLRFAATHV